MSKHAAPSGSSPRRARRARREEAPVRRTPAVVAVAAIVGAVVAAGTVVDRRQALDPSAGEAAAAALAPLAPPSSAGGSTAFCAGGTGSEGGAAHVVHLSNPGEAPVVVDLTVVPGAARGEAVGAEPEAVDLEVPAGGSVDVPLAEVVDAPYLAAVVEAGPGELVVEHSVEGESDSALVPCASASSSTWHVASGVTTRDAREELLLFNPFPDGAVVDISLTTPEGQRVPAAFTGLIVPARQVVAVDVGAVVSRHPVVAASIRARSGRLVVDRLQRFDGSDGPAGLDLTAAAPSAGLVWAFADGSTAEGETEVVTVYNPTDEAAEVDVEVVLDPSPDPAQPIAAEPFQLSIPPLRFAQVDVHADERVPAGRGHRITVRSQNGVAVVAERWIRGEGLSATLGTPVAARRWLGSVAGLEATGGGLVVANPGGEAVRAVVSSPDPAAAAALGGAAEVEIAAGGRVVVDLVDLADLDLEGPAGVVVVVQATGPVVVERVLRLGSGGGRSLLVAGAATAAVLPAEAAVATGPPPTVTSTSTTSTTTSTSTTPSTSTSTTSAPGSTSTTTEGATEGTAEPTTTG